MNEENRANFERKLHRFDTTIQPVPLNTINRDESKLPDLCKLYATGIEETIPERCRVKCEYGLLENPNSDDELLYNPTLSDRCCKHEDEVYSWDIVTPEDITLREDITREGDEESKTEDRARESKEGDTVIESPSDTSTFVKLNRQEYQSRLAEITAEINNAQRDGDRGEIIKLMAEKAKILRENAPDIAAERRNREERENSRNIQDWGQNSDHFMFVIGEGDQTQVVCYDKLSILELVSDRPKWLLECTGPWARSTERVRDLRSLRVNAALHFENSQDNSRLQLNKIFGKEMATGIIQHEHDLAAINCLLNTPGKTTEAAAAEMRARDYNIELADLDKDYEILKPGALNTVPGFSGDKVLNSFGEEMYAGIVVNTDGFKLFVDVRELKSLLILLGRGVKIFYLTPKLDASLSHTIRYSNAHPIWNGAPEDEPDFVSTQHCQHGSAIVVNQISICVGDNCTLTSAVADDINKTFVPDEDAPLLARLSELERLEREEELQQWNSSPATGANRSQLGDGGAVERERAAAVQEEARRIRLEQNEELQQWNASPASLAELNARLSGEEVLEQNEAPSPARPRSLDFGEGVSGAQGNEDRNAGSVVFGSRWPEGGGGAADLAVEGEYTPSVTPPDWAINEAVETAFSDTEDHTSEWASAIVRRIVNSELLIRRLWGQGHAIMANMANITSREDYQVSLDEFSRFLPIQETATEATDAAEQNARNGHFTDLIAWEIVMQTSVNAAFHIYSTIETIHDLELSTESSGSELAEEES
jgi:hypothetical protein